MHILIVGRNGTPRSEFIDRLIKEAPAKILYGYRSVKEEENEDGRAPIYIYPVDGKRTRSDDNLLGWCKQQKSESYPEVFERYAHLIEEAKDDGLLVLDEIGPMESKSPRFCAAVLNALDGDIPVIASVRDKDTDFLKKVRNHPKARCFFINTAGAPHPAEASGKAQPKAAPAGAPHPGTATGEARPEKAEDGAHPADEQSYSESLYNEALALLRKNLRI